MKSLRFSLVIVVILSCAVNYAVSEIVSLNTAEHGQDGMIREETPGVTANPKLELRNLTTPQIIRHRTVVLGFDLSGFDPDSIEAAELQLQFGPSPRSEPTTIKVFGVKPSFGIPLQQNWTRILTYNSAPWLTGHDGNMQTFDHLDGALVDLGSFVHTGIGGLYQHSSSSLVDFLRNTPEGQAIIYLEGAADTTWVDLSGAAVRIHPDDTPPTLKLKLLR